MQMVQKRGVRVVKEGTKQILPSSLICFANCVCDRWDASILVDEDGMTMTRPSCRETCCGRLSAKERKHHYSHL